ncbi:jouberin [Eurytemora carolleeae]|uniref:jouberin n=1 Tax=Eurytemora carolleeae TaxID=1294199 RepID=UPI000C761DD1|nr:jouberin [Eurytemora carolleeae]|eukprot:XP_023336520.1 jouberin-like [Eurytemora affinis]
MSEELPLSGVVNGRSRRIRKKVEKEEEGEEEGRKSKTKNVTGKRNKKTKKREKSSDPSDSLNNSYVRTTEFKSENRDRINNDISNHRARKKDVNPAKEERRRRRERERINQENENTENGGQQDEIIEPQPDLQARVIGVFIHECEVLKMDFLIAHPVVKVSLVDGLTGNFLEKTNPSRRVTSYYEDEKVSRILPLMTQPFDFRLKRDILPKWEELLLFNDDFDATFEKHENIVMFFEIIDFVSMAVANENYRNKLPIN